MSQTYSEIKLRNPKPEVCDNIAIIISRYGESSASKALVRYINDVVPIQNKIDRLTSKNECLQKHLIEMEQANKDLSDELNMIRSAYNNFTALLQATK